MSHKGFTKVDHRPKQEKKVQEQQRKTGEERFLELLATLVQRVDHLSNWHNAINPMFLQMQQDIGTENYLLIAIWKTLVDIGVIPVEKAEEAFTRLGENTKEAVAVDTLCTYLLLLANRPDKTEEQSEEQKSGHPEPSEEDPYAGMTEFGGEV